MQNSLEWICRTSCVTVNDFIAGQSFSPNKMNRTSEARSAIKISSQWRKRKRGPVPIRPFPLPSIPSFFEQTNKTLPKRLKVSFTFLSFLPLGLKRCIFPKKKRFHFHIVDILGLFIKPFNSRVHCRSTSNSLTTSESLIVLEFIWSLPLYFIILMKGIVFVLSSYLVLEAFQPGKIDSTGKKAFVIHSLRNKLGIVFLWVVVSSLSKYNCMKSRPTVWSI